MSRYAELKPESGLGQALIKANLVAKEHLLEAIQLSKKTNQSPGEILCVQYGADPAKFYGLLSEKSGNAYVDLQKTAVDPAVAKAIPVKIAWHYGFLPLKVENNRATIAVSYPFNLKTLDEIQLHLGYSITQVLARHRDITNGLKKHYGFAADTVEKIVASENFEDADAAARASETPVEEIDKLAEDASVIRLVNEIIYDAYQKRATDIHFEPYRGQFRLRNRIDGVLHDTNLSQNARHLILPILSRIKIMANLNIVERRLPQDGRAVVKVKNQNLDLRVSSIPTPHGESIVIRILPTQMIFDLKKLGLSEQNVRMFDQLIHKPHGIILLTGPTGSGKTTTLYACLNQLNSKTTKIITIEDPVEYEIPGITQIQVTTSVGLTFAAGLRSMLRHDPDVMMIGEIRDFETAEIAIRAALTGHLVYSTLHTNDAASGVTRLLDIGLEPFLVASSVNAIIAQRLVRTICQKCKQEDKSQTATLKQKIARDLGLRSEKEVKIFRGKGCEDCNNTGFRGRTAIHEVLSVSERVKELVSQKASGARIKQQAMREGMTTLLQDGWKKVTAGVTTPAEVINVADIGETTGAPVPVSPPSEAVPKRPAGAAPERPSSPSAAHVPAGASKRTYERTSTDLPVNYRHIEIHYRLFDVKSKKILATERERVAYSENISASGMLVKIPELFNLGTVVEVRFKLFEHGNKEIQCLARVVRVEESVEPNVYFTGIMFLDLSTADRAYLDDFVKKSKRGVHA